MTPYADVEVLLWKLIASVVVAKWPEGVHKFCNVYFRQILQTICLLQLLLQFDELIWLNQFQQAHLLQGKLSKIFNKYNLRVGIFAVDWYLLSNVKECSICKVDDQGQIRKFFRSIDLSLELLVSEFLLYRVWLYGLYLNKLSFWLWLGDCLALCIYNFLNLCAKGLLWYSIWYGGVLIIVRLNDRPSLLSLS
jgi:hypothetical protein